MKFNTQIHICSLLGCLGCLVAQVPWLAQVPRLAGLALVACLGLGASGGAQEFKSP